MPSAEWNLGSFSRNYYEYEWARRFLQRLPPHNQRSCGQVRLGFERLAIAFLWHDSAGSVTAELRKAASAPNLLRRSKYRCARSTLALELPLRYNDRCARTTPTLNLPLRKKNLALNLPCTAKRRPLFSAHIIENDVFNKCP